MKNKFWFLFVLLIICINTAVYGAGTFTWEINNYPLFNKGKLLKVKLNEDGFLTMAFDFEKLVDIDTVFIWDIKEDSKGNIFLATGNDGIIYKLDKDRKLSEFFRTSSIAAFKMLIDKEDNMYVTTLTKGLIYKINTQGKGSVFSVFQDEYIWDMKFYKGNILLASGFPGSLYELDLSTKKTKELIMTKEMHITCMDIDDDNNIYFGTSDKGAVYRLSKNKDLKVVYQTGKKEVHSLVVHKGTGVIYAGTSDKEFSYVKFKPEQKFDSQFEKPEKMHEDFFDEMKDFKKIKMPANAVYEIKENEYVNKIIESKDSTFLSLILDEDILYIGSGDTGIIYQYNNRKIEKFAQLDEQQVLCFYQPANKKILFGTGNIGNIYQIEKQHAEKGVYVSDIFDGQGWAFWGKIQWDEKKPFDTDITVQTRSGNTEDVDDTWSDWSEPYKYNKGSQITSPDGRFLQFKINFWTKNKEYTPEIYSLKIPYLIKNRKPEVLSVKFLEKESNGKAKNNRKKPSFKKHSFKEFELKVEWDAKDEDKDELIYRLYVRMRKENNWFLLKDKLKEKSYLFDTRMLPDGIYLFKVVADDIPSNSISTHLQDERISRIHMIDNTPPQVKLEYKKKDKDEYIISGKIMDNLSLITSIEYSVDTKEWTSVFPVDKLFDSIEEEFQFNYKYEKGLIIIKTEDEAGNSATSYIRIEK